MSYGLLICTYRQKTHMSTLHHEALLESLYEEAYVEVKNNNLFNLDEEGIVFNAQCIAQQRFEDLCQ